MKSKAISKEQTVQLQHLGYAGMFQYSSIFDWFLKEHSLYVEITVWSGIGFVSMIKEIKIEKEFDQDYFEVYRSEIVDQGLPIWDIDYAKYKALDMLIEMKK